MQALKASDHTEFVEIGQQNNMRLAGKLKLTTSRAVTITKESN